MPANGRRDLIRRLKVKYYILVYEMSGHKQLMINMGMQHSFSLLVSLKNLLQILNKNCERMEALTEVYHKLLKSQNFLISEGKGLPVHALQVYQLQTCSLQTFQLFFFPNTATL